MFEGIVVEFTNLRRDLSGTWFLNRRFYTTLTGIGIYHYPLVTGLNVRSPNNPRVVPVVSSKSAT